MRFIVYCLIASQQMIRGQNNMSIELSNPTLWKVLNEARKLCDDLEKPFDLDKVGVTTDYGTHVVLYYRDEEEEDDDD